MVLLIGVIIYELGWSFDMNLKRYLVKNNTVLDRVERRVRELYLSNSIRESGFGTGKRLFHLYCTRSDAYILVQG